MSPGSTDLQTAQVETAWGRITLEASPAGICRCSLPLVPANPPPFRVIGTQIPRKAYPHLRRGVQYICSMLKGKAPGKCPPLDPAVNRTATAFRRAIWRAMRRIPRGRTVTYSELSRKAGFPAAARAAGGACGANPLPLLVPCHRVIGEGGRLGGFSSGTAWKRMLLALEGVQS